VDNAIAPVVDNATAPIVDNAVAPIVDNAVAPIVDNAVAPVVDNAVAPVVDNAVAPTVDNVVTSTADDVAEGTLDDVVTSTVDDATSLRSPEAGAGGEWAVIDEVSDSSVIKQLTPNACGPAAGQMVLADAGLSVSQGNIAAQVGKVRTSPQSLSDALNLLDTSNLSRWRGAGVADSSIPALNTRGPWIAMLRGSDNHWVVVDGYNSVGNLLIRDPWDATRYSMTTKTFIEEAWTGFAVFRQ
jgi:hypothetical protein